MIQAPGLVAVPRPKDLSAVLGLPHHATLGPATAYYASPVDGGGPHSPSKYHENGHDTFSDFVTLVCQEAQSTNLSQTGGGQVSIA
jgi:hypothetical protein